MALVEPKHSEHFFTDAREFWWNKDFLQLMARRWKLEGVHSVLDVGCGVGHWTASFMDLLSPETRFSAVDREPDWVLKSQSRFGSRVTVKESSAEQLPFPDSSFDAVTCQTLLIHVKDPAGVIKEMLRVLKPGGLLAVAEPSNAAQTHDSTEQSPELATALFRMNHLCERGKIALGEGNTSLGDLLPGMFAKVGLQGIQVYTSDKAAAIYPPYEGAGQRELLADRIRDADTDYYMFGLEQTRRYFLAGGGSIEEFERSWKLALEHQRTIRKAIQAGTFHSAGGHVMYLVSGRKPL